MKGLSATILIICLCAVEIFAIALTYRAIVYPMKYKSEIIEISAKHEISPVLIASVINVESKFKYDAKSSAGAVGLMQIMPNTARYICKLKDIQFSSDEELYNIEKNIEIGTVYLEYLIDKFNVLETALAAYNAGETNVRSWLNNSDYSSDGQNLKVIPFKETKLYVEKVLKNISFYSKNYF